jgi:UDP-N-acetylglucosamine--N-acetylmuramyl-(pentapeptide) pyrophosphoryl-undecaprenol N-acetylglucosamine transferase
MNKHNVIFAGGETAGPITPLLALAKEWQAQTSNIHPIFLDVKRSVAAHVIPRYGFEFRVITSGKFRRYWSFKNLWTPFQILFGLVQSIILFSRLKPLVIVGAGGYVQVPVIIAGWLMRIPIVIHQQDIEPTLSNKLCAPFAGKITTTFEKSQKDFPQGSGFEKDYDNNNKIIWTGNPNDIDVVSRPEAQKLFNLNPDWPTVVVIGGGSGSVGLNQLIAHSLPELIKICQIIHGTGVGKQVKPPANIPQIHDRYHQFEFIDDRSAAFSAADIVIARAGVATITDLAALGKVCIIVPMPNSHQELNAQFLYERNAALVVDQTDVTPDLLAKVIRKVLFDVKLQKQLQKNISEIMPKNATENMLAVVKELIHG